MIRHASTQSAAISDTDRLKRFASTPQFMGKVIDSLPQCVFWKDRNSVYLGCNALFASLAGLRCPEEIVGRTDFDLPWLAGESQFFVECDQRIMATQKPELGIVESCTRNGKTSWLETNKVPIFDDEGTVIGILGAFHDITTAKEAELALKRSNKALQHRNKHDNLTDLFNRDHLLSELKEAIGLDRKFALLFIDIDRFKMVNDSLGHSAADKVLVSVSRALRRSVRAHDLVSRFGGDEFAIMLPDIESPLDVLLACERIQTMLSTVCSTMAPMTVTASIGAVIDLGHQYENPEDALRDADTAMYEAKRSGRNCCCVFNERMQTRVKEKMSLEKEFRNGLKNEEFHLYFQPIHHLASGKLKGFEALVRWQHPTRGVVPPSEFILLAEESGLIVEMGEQVVKQACQQLARWRADFPAHAAHLTISINLSPVQLKGNRFLDVLDTNVSQNGLNCSDINIEITEGILMDDRDDIRELFNSLRAKGYQLLLDDFGTGYCSLSYLHRFPLNTLKIDRSFIQAMEEDQSSQAIVKTILGLAEILHLNVVAEGVETRAQETFLRAMNCDLVQGFLYARPLPPKDASQYLTQH